MPRRLACAAAAVLLAASVGAAQDPRPASPEGILSFADALLRAGESFRAATEYMRFLHYYPEAPAAPRALEGLGRAYALAGRWAQAAEAFRRAHERAPSPERRLLLGAALYRAGRAAEAARLLLVPGAPGAHRILGTLALIRSGNPATVLPGSRQDILQDYAALPRKHPVVAGGLAAVLPGAGHLYAGRPRDAAVSFAVNGLFLWGTWRAVRSQQWALAGILGVLELGWYSGNVVSAVNAAHKWNRREEGRFFSRWEEAAVPRWNLVALPGGGAAVGIAWRW